MKIGIDTRVPTKNKTGIAYILDNILPHLVNIDKEVKYIFLGDSFDVKSGNVKNIKFSKIFQRGINFLWKNLHFPSAGLFTGKTDSFFFPNFVDFPVNSKKKILLVSDLSYIKYPQFSERKNLKFLNKNVGHSIIRADKIITISENAKREIVEYYGASAEKVEVVYLGCPGNVKKVTDINIIESTKTKYGISGNYILFVGTLEPRKNIEGLIKAYNNLGEEIKKEVKLVICGGKGWYYDKIFSIVDELSLKENVIFTGYTNDLDKSSLYSGAAAFIFPSFYEGFGMPILEAFECGVPVVAADNSSLKEVGGDAVVYCNADNIESIKESILKVLDDNGLRSDMVRKGYEQLRKFSWEESAKKIFEILNN